MNVYQEGKPEGGKNESLSEYGFSSAGKSGENKNESFSGYEFSSAGKPGEDKKEFSSSKDPKRDKKMKSWMAFAWKELKAQRMTAVLILIAVVLSTVMTTVLGQSLGILQSMRITQAAYLNGNRYAAFHQLTAEQAEKLHEDDRLYDVGDVLNVGNMPLGNSSLTLYLREYHGDALEMYPSVGKIKEGHLPEKANEIALPEDTLAYLNLDAAVGNTISLALSAIVQDGSIPRYDYSEYSRHLNPPIFI